MLETSCVKLIVAQFEASSNGRTAVSGTAGGGSNPPASAKNTSFLTLSPFCRFLIKYLLHLDWRIEIWVVSSSFIITDHSTHSGKPSS